MRKRNGSYVLQKPCYLLDLSGNIVGTFKSKTEAARWLGYPNSSHIAKSSRNPETTFESKINGNRYRCVGVQFYEENKEEVLSYEKVYEKNLYVLSKEEKEKVLVMLFGPYKKEWYNKKGVVENSDRIIAKRLGLNRHAVQDFTTDYTKRRAKYFNELINENIPHHKIKSLLSEVTL